MEEQGPFGNEQAKAGPEPVWTYRGYQLKASEFTTAMVHLHRAEVHRSNVWRQRLDATTNWAVITAGAAISIAFSQSGNHAVFLVDLMLITIFLIIEARRYRYYEIWAYRVRLMETDFFAAMLVPPFHPSPDWAEALADNLLTPRFPISYWEAIGRRLRRNYLYIYGVIGIAWIARIGLAPSSEIVGRVGGARGSGTGPGHLRAAPLRALIPGAGDLRDSHGRAPTLRRVRSCHVTRRPRSSNAKDKESPGFDPVISANSCSRSS